MMEQAGSKSGARKINRETTEVTKRSSVLGVGSLALLVLIGVAIIISVSGGVRYRYVSHRNAAGENLYFEMPANWTLFHQRQLLAESSAHLNSAQIAQVESQSWVNAFSGAPRATLSRQSGIASKVPFGIIQAYQLPTSQKNNFSLASLRVLLLPQDPLTAVASSTSNSYKILSYAEFVRPGSFRGSHMVVDVKLPNGTMGTLDQVAMVNSATTWVFLIGVGCDKSCFSHYQSQIESVVSSWSVKEPR